MDDILLAEKNGLLMICVNAECYNWECEHDNNRRKVMELDETNCRVYTGEELLDGACSIYMPANVWRIK